MAALIQTSYAQKETRFLLDTVDSGDGSWPCLFYELNRNTDITLAEKAKWASLDEDESYWRTGVGPFSNDGNKFLVTQWESTVHPILIRRHFTLTEEELGYVNEGVLTLTYSYDENPRFWLNGTSLFSTTGWNDNNYASYVIPKTKKAVLQVGDNVLCVSLKQGAGGGHIDFGLSLKYTPNPDGIEAVSSATDVHEATYNLQGQPVSPSYQGQGIVIRGGKKMLNKKNH